MNGHITDTMIKTSARNALQANEAFRGKDLVVSAINGDVLLRGQLDSTSQINLAVELVRATPGVHTIHNQLSARDN